MLIFFPACWKPSVATWYLSQWKRREGLSPRLMSIGLKIYCKKLEKLTFNGQDNCDLDEILYGDGLIIDDIQMHSPGSQLKLSAFFENRRSESSGPLYLQ